MSLKSILITLTLAVASTATLAEETAVPENLTIIESTDNFADTVSNIENGLKDKGLTIFAIIDHAQAAADAGLSMPPTKVIIFGNPKGGTPLMQKAPKLALQLPLKVLVAEDEDGRVQVSLFKAGYLAESIGEKPELTAPLAKAEGLIKQLVANK